MSKLSQCCLELSHDDSGSGIISSAIGIGMTIMALFLVVETVLLGIAYLHMQQIAIQAVDTSSVYLGAQNNLEERVLIGDTVIRKLVSSNYSLINPVWTVQGKTIALAITTGIPRGSLGFFKTFGLTTITVHASAALEFLRS